MIDRGSTVLGRSVLTIKQTTDALVVARKEIGLEVYAVKLSTWSCLEIRTQGAVTI